MALQWDPSVTVDGRQSPSLVEDEGFPRVQPGAGPRLPWPLPLCCAVDFPCPVAKRDGHTVELSHAFGMSRADTNKETQKPPSSTLGPQ
eukprot:CAMPEP_0174374822 /NCGR_PEP_ID=MMETSP0811_2-20130205/112341_1 /TAXON_ID=73025 ORGANISM="Eutreptiella gymnastica-like, Strain CCMP1594" /NCGR_SAMPLE_ID=MMETSP0811_2 /ASSEMBLY_ACC=CAM_ASM_000667 /LENGTH=88 /DNA_ID=CAMNT_0015524483 /DNA_START=29 /DNA_END=292 /DNA_ORIENTATION=-